MAKVALITGANGITGNSILEYLTKTNDFSEIFALYRREPSFRYSDPRVKVVLIDLTSDLNELISKLKAAGADRTTHVFFTAYIHSFDQEELVKKNGPMFENFIRAIDSIAPSLEAITLQTGGKYYGVHLRDCEMMIESMGRFESNLPNFYFVQEDFLRSFQSEGKKNWKWNITMPGPIIGLSKGNGMSLVPGLAVYFLVQKELGKKALWPGNSHSYHEILDCSYAPLIAEFSVFISTHPQFKNDLFNIYDDEKHFTWENIWCSIGRYYGVEIEEPTFKVTSSNAPSAGKGFSDAARLEFSLADYIKDKKNVWETIVKKHGGRIEAWDWAAFDFIDAHAGMNWGIRASMEKAKQLGWKRTVNTIDTIFECFHAYEEEGSIPRPKKE